jgi:hypothetical protein
LFAIVCDARTLQGALALRPNHCVAHNVENF